VVEIIERSKQPIIGPLAAGVGVWLVAPEDKRYGQDVLIPTGATSVAKTGQVVVGGAGRAASLVVGQPVGRIKEVLGEVDDPGMEIEIAVRKYSVPHEFSTRAWRLRAACPTKFAPQDKADRVDLTDVPLVTIDGEDARDFDDAVYCEPPHVGVAASAVKGWRLLVAIADVSHYVKTGSAIGRGCLRPRHQRCTSRAASSRCCPRSCPTGCAHSIPRWSACRMVCDMFVTRGRRGAMPTSSTRR